MKNNWIFCNSYLNELYPSVTRLGNFWKFLIIKFQLKLAKIFGDWLLRLFWKTFVFNLKTATFGQFLRKIRLLFISSSGQTGCDTSGRAVAYFTVNYSEDNLKRRPEVDLIKTPWLESYYNCTFTIVQRL